MEKTRTIHCQDTAKSRHLPPPLPELPFDATAAQIALPEPDLLQDQQENFVELIEVRSSVRQYHNRPLTIKELSYLLWCTQGVKMMMPGGANLRNVPSAGARHAFETYLYIQNVEGVEPGFYRFLAMEHALLPLGFAKEQEEMFLEAFKVRDMPLQAAVTFIWAAVPERMTYLFGERAYRYIHLDAGHVCQNLYLAAQTIQTGVCAIAGFDDEKINTAMHFDGETQFVVYAASAGK